MSFRAHYHDAPDRLTVANKTRVLIQFTKISSLPILVLTEKKLFRNIVPITYYTKYILLFNFKLRFTHQHMNALTFSNIQRLSYFAITWLTCGLMSVIIRPSFWCDFSRPTNTFVLVTCVNFVWQWYPCLIWRGVKI